MEKFYYLFNLINKKIIVGFLITVVIFLSSSYSGIRFRDRNFLINVNDLIRFYIEKKEILIILFLISVIFYTFNSVSKIKFELIPFNFDFYKKVEIKNKTKKIFDKLVKYKKDEFLIFKNSISNYDLYLKQKDNLEQYLNKKIEIERYKNNSVKIIFENMIKLLNFNKDDYVKDKIFLGIDKHNQKIYLDFDKFSHSILIGESGSGKSVFIQNLILSFFKNLEKIEKFYLVDFKIVEFDRYKNQHEKIEVITDIQKFLITIKQIQKVMFERFEEMRKKGEVKSKKPFIIVLIDEFRTLKNNPDKNIVKETESILIDLIQKRRRRNIRLILRGQKRDTQNLSSNVLRNIQTRILMKTTSPDNISKIRGTNEDLEDINLSSKDFKNFGKGRLLFKDGDSGERFLIQSPFFNIEDDSHSSYMFSLLETKNKTASVVEVYKKPPKTSKRETFTDEVGIVEKKEKVEKTIKKGENMKLLKEELEKVRSDFWEKSKNLKDKDRRSRIRKELFKIKKLINNNELEERNELLKNIKNI